MSSVFVIGAMADVRGDARINLDILGRLGVTVVEIADEQHGSCTFPRSRNARLIVDAIFGTGLQTPLAGMLETVVADVNARHPDCLDRPAERPVRRHTDLVGDCIDASMTVTLARRSCHSCCRRPRRRRATS